MQKKKRKIIWIILLCLLLLTGVGMFCHLRSNLFFVAKDWAAHLISSNEYSFQQVDSETLALRKYTIDELSADSRVTFDESMQLINVSHPLSTDYEPAVSLYGDTSVTMNDCVQETYSALSAAVREQFDQPLYIRSSYRSREEQEAEYTADPSKATLPGSSEHEAGLAMDVYVPYFAGSAFIKAPAGQWVYSHCSDFGFIIRYPYYGKKSTGIRFEPWHLRYVGQPHAKIITENRLTLEEYMEKLQVGAFYRIGNFLITRQSGDTILLPETFSSAIISPDNMGNWMTTIQIR